MEELQKDCPEYFCPECSNKDFISFQCFDLEERKLFFCCPFCQVLFSVPYQGPTNLTGEEQNQLVSFLKNKYPPRFIDPEFSELLKEAIPLLVREEKTGVVAEIVSPFSGVIPAKPNLGFPN